MKAGLLLPELCGRLALEGRPTRGVAPISKYLSHMEN